MKQSNQFKQRPISLFSTYRKKLHYALFPDDINIIQGSETLHSWARLPETEALAVETRGAARIPP